MNTTRILAAVLALGLSSAAHAQSMPEPDATEVAKTPLRDLNIDGRDIPEVLQVAVRDPYATAGMDKCDALVTEIAALDSELGADYDIALDDGSHGQIWSQRHFRNVSVPLALFRDVFHDPESRLSITTRAGPRVFRGRRV